jgi:hypothetical protein
MEITRIFTTVFHYYHVRGRKSAATFRISASTGPLTAHYTLGAPTEGIAMTATPPDKAGLHILLKLASLVVILAGIHAAADILVQLLLALFFAIVLNPLVTWFIRRGISRPVAITIVVVVMMIILIALFGVLAASMNEFVAMLPKYNRELTRKLVDLQQMLPFLNLHISPERRGVYRPAGAGMVCETAVWCRRWRGRRPLSDTP